MRCVLAEGMWLVQVASFEGAVVCVCVFVCVLTQGFLNEELRRRDVRKRARRVH